MHTLKKIDIQENIHFNTHPIHSFIENIYLNLLLSFTLSEYYSFNLNDLLMESKIS